MPITRMVIKQALSRRRYDVVQLESLYTTPYIDIIRRHAPMLSFRSGATTTSIRFSNSGGRR